MNRREDFIPPFPTEMRVLEPSEAALLEHQDMAYQQLSRSFPDLKKNGLYLFELRGRTFKFKTYAPDRDIGETEPRHYLYPNTSPMLHGDWFANIYDEASLGRYLKTQMPKGFWASLFS